MQALVWLRMVSLSVIGLMFHLWISDYLAYLRTKFKHKNLILRSSKYYN